MGKHVGRQTVVFDRPPVIASGASVVGPKEGQGPLASYFDEIWKDEMDGEKSWEKAESKLMKRAITLAIEKAGLKEENIQYILAGDLLNQLTASHFAIRDFSIPFLGMYGACSTMGLSMEVGAMLLDGGFADYVAVSASSHFCTSEKQFRMPLNYGSQRPLYATWTVTGSGSLVLAANGDGPRITAATAGQIVDYGIKDAFNMGGAMAPAAADVMKAHFQDLNRGPDYYDLIITGDLGYYGTQLTRELLEKEGFLLDERYTDCGIQIYDKEAQDTHGGGSGCGCSAVTMAGYLLSEIQKGAFHRVLLIPTGALLSPLSTQQGESIPCVAHAVVIEKE